jgi:hypothetical protein
MASDPNLTRSFSVSPTQFANFKVQAAAHDIVVSAGNTGSVDADGVEIQFSYDGSTTLVLTILDKPFFLSADFIFSQLEPYLK